nr:MAG TPA: methyltransferase [Caudoviricetes sp.]
MVKNDNDRIIAVIYSQADKIITCYVSKFPL